ncbi:unnamed protein product [Oppiella nova]|uniref:CUB domain-containing protein n=1 Tax=Oppiella nova TaxID=334625 RepID=A0A7R9QU47_9ACAR|nr:unnamed protein product [Oppiella nova]CAG2175002.1 unnamed protein product [Oppiella nova]
MYVVFVIPRTCGGIAAQNSTYFTNPGFPSAYNNNNTLDFMDFELMQPNDGNCDNDQFMITGQNLNSVVPQMCGYNTGHHCI